MKPIVALRDQATTGPFFKSASPRLSSKRSRSGIAKAINVYLVSSSTTRTVQLLFKLDITWLVMIARFKRCILKMESAS